MQRLGLLVAAAVVTAVTACGAGSAGPAAAPPAAAALVDTKNIAFNPSSLTIHSGQAVAWHFDDGVTAHNVTGDGWRSPDRTSGYYAHRFTSPGSYNYQCTIHIGMTGKVVVTP